jgi:hypothetical protein
MSIKLVLLINFLAVRPGDPKDEKPNDAYKWKSLPFLLTAKDSGPTIFPSNNRVAFWSIEFFSSVPFKIGKGFG